MKLVAAKDFYNSKRLGIKVATTDKHFRHAAHVHKGHRFSIGTSEIYNDLGAQEQEDVGTLLKHGCAVLDDEGNKHVIAKIDAEAAEQFEAHKASLAKPPTLAEAIATAFAVALPAALIAAGIVPAKAAAPAK